MPAVGVVAIAVALGVLSIVLNRPELGQRFDYVAAALLVLTTLLIVARRLLVHPIVSQATVLGALGLYLLLGCSLASCSRSFRS